MNGRAVHGAARVFVVFHATDERKNAAARVCVAGSETPKFLVWQLLSQYGHYYHFQSQD
jgi:hypothetical protein